MSVATQFVMMEADRLERMERKLDALAEALRSSTIIPTPEWRRIRLLDPTEGLRVGDFVPMLNGVLLAPCPMLGLALRRKNSALPNALAQHFRPPFISVFSDRSHDYAQCVICA